MGEKLVLQGRGAYHGVVEGYAIVCPESIAGNSGGVGDTDGVIHEASNSAYGRCIKEKILVLPGAKGFNGFSAHFKSAVIAGFSPAGWVVTRMGSRIAGTVVSLQTPAVTDFEEQDPVAVLKTGDYLRIDGNCGRVEVLIRANL